jgi:MoaA/NifB/PqqE/SkfB family radical SAM enzyme
LVLFPEIKFEKKIISGFFMIEILEEKLWTIRIIFQNKYQKENIFVTHIDFIKNNNEYTTKNWQFSWNNINLLTEVYNIILKKDINDFNFFKDKEFYYKIPFWTVLTITSKCNIFCDYCFNDYDYLLKDRNNRENIWLEKYKLIVDILYKSWTRDIIITWWEPFTESFLWELLSYIKAKWIFIRINTNWTLFSDKILKKLNDNFVINLMVSMHEFNNKDYYEINKIWGENIKGREWIKSFKNRFDQKTIQLKKIKNYNNLSLDFLTILTPKNILYLERIYDFILNNFNIENWHFFRLYPTWTTKWISKEMINLAIHKLYKLNILHNTNFKIVDSVPFCVTKDVEIACKVIDWELSEHHNIKTIITTKWDIQIMCAFDSNLWNIFEKDLLDVWQWKYVQGMLKNWFLPKECNNCKYSKECRWWSRMNANICNWSYNAFDPLWNINNKIVI